MTGVQTCALPIYQEVCKERDATYAVPLKATVRLISNETGEVKEDTVFMGDFPKMTKQGTFIYNGAERAIITQLVRSPGPYYGVELDNKSGLELFSTTVIPNRGAWLEYETDANEVLSVRVDRTRKQPVTVLIKAMNLFLPAEEERFGSNPGLRMESDEEILRLFGKDERLIKTLQKDTSLDSSDGIKEIYKKLRPGEPPTESS